MNEPPTIPNDWPEEIAEQIVAPVAYLRVQASKLTQMTRGLVAAEVSVTSRHHRVLLALDLVVPALDEFRKELLRAEHAADAPYPVRVVADEFGPDPDNPEDHEWPSARTYAEFRTLVRTVLQSPETISVVQSLIVKSNDSLPVAG